MAVSDRKLDTITIPTQGQLLRHGGVLDVLDVVCIMIIDYGEYRC